MDVGQADAILIKQGASAMLVDAGNNADAEFVVQYKTRASQNWIMSSEPIPMKIT